jgi:cysteine desulfurase
LIYLDHNATSPVDARVIAAMEPYWTERWGNASSVHSAGRAARRAVEEAREHVAALVGADDSEEIVFTSGGTEADALALGAARAIERRSIAVSSVEHPAVAEMARALEAEGLSRAILPVLASGALDREVAWERIDASVGLVSVMWANNEYGGLFPIAEVADRAHASGALLHTDAVAALGKTEVSARSGADMISLSAHKIGGPKGTGALYVRRGVELPSLLPGGGQEKGRRGGTENVAGIVGFGEAARLCRLESAAERAAVETLRDGFEDAVLRACSSAQIWGRSAPRIGNTSAIAFGGASGEAVAIALDLEGIAVSVGSACSSGSVAPSPAILALGASRPDAKATVRFSFGRGNGPGDGESTVRALARILPKFDLDRQEGRMREWRQE